MKQFLPVLTDFLNILILANYENDCCNSVILGICRKKTPGSKLL